MAASWNNPELQELWTLSHEELALLPAGTDKWRLSFAVQLKFMALYGRFPERADEIHPDFVAWVATQLGIPADAFTTVDLDGRQGRCYRRAIRTLLGFHPTTAADLKRLSLWLSNDVLPFDPQARHGRDLAHDWCRAEHIEPPAFNYLDRVIRSAVRSYETGLQKAILSRLTTQTRVNIDRLLTVGDLDPDDSQTRGAARVDAVSFAHLKTDPGKPSLDNLLACITKLQCIDAIGLNGDLFIDISTKFIEQFCRRCATESTRELRRHPPVVRYSMAAMFCWRRRQQLTDALIDLLLQLIHNLGTRAEKKIDKRQFAAFKKVRGKARLLFKLAEATVDQPDGIVKEVVYPVVSQKTLQELVTEFQAMGFDFEREVQETMRASYGHHYRRMLSPVLDALDFRSNNTAHRPVIDALAILQANRDSRRQYYDTDEVPLDGVITQKWRHIVVEKTKDGVEHIHRINYEICVLRALRRRLRTKEIWVVGADRYRDPEQDLPADFAAKRVSYYTLLQAPLEPQAFIDQVQASMHQGLETLNGALRNNPKVRLRQQGKNRIHLAPLDRQAEPTNTEALKREIGRRWPDVELIDVIKEVDLRVDFTAAFHTSGSRETLEPSVLQRRLLLCLFGIGTNIGLKRVASQQPGVSFDELRYVKRRFVRKEALRAAIAEVVTGPSQSAIPPSGATPPRLARRIPSNSVPMTRT